MCKIIPYSPTLKITNLEQLPRGLNAPYLEVIESHIPDVYIAKQWRRKPDNVNGTLIKL
jgi:hypothetical protein